MTDGNILETNFQEGSRKWPDKFFVHTLAAFFFLLPLQARYIFRAPLEVGVPYEYGTLSLFLVEILGWVLIALGFTRTLKHDNTVTKSVKVLLCLSVILAFLSIAWALDKAVAAQSAVRLLEGVLLFIVTRYTLHVTRYTIVWAFIAGAVLQAGLGIYQFLTQSSFASSFLGMALHDPIAAGTSVVEFADQRWLRAYGGLSHPNVLGGYLVVALALIIKIFCRAEKDKTQLGAAAPNCVMRILPIIRWAIIPILGTGIFFTFSRAAWIAAIGLLSYWVIKSLVKYRHFEESEATKNPVAHGNYGIIHSLRSFWMTKIYVLLTTFYVLFLVVLCLPLVVARFSSQPRLEVISRVERVEGARESWTLIKKHPVLGVGIGNYTQAVREEVRPGDPLYTYQPVHSIPLLIWAELGLIGLLLFVIVLYKIAIQSKFYILHFTFFILLLFDHYLWSLPFGILLFWAVLGLSTYNPQDGLDKKTAL